MATTLSLAAGRVPPHDLDAETSVIGSILLDALSIGKVLQWLHPEDFYRENNGQIYRAALDLFAAGEPIDNVTLAAQLQTMGLLDRVGGRAQLASIQGAVPTAANIEYYGKIVKEKAYKRRLISAGGNIAGLGYDDSVEAGDAVNQAQSLVFAVAEDRDQRELEKLYDLLVPAMERISFLMESGKGVVGVPSGFHDLDRLTGGFKESDLIVVAGRPAMGKCLRYDSLVDDPATGERLTIEEAVQRQTPTIHGFTSEGRITPNRVAAWVDSGIKPCFKVTTRSGRSVEVTGHHPFLTVRGWEPLHDITVGEKIAVPRGIDCFGSDRSWSLGRVRRLAGLIARDDTARDRSGEGGKDDPPLGWLPEPHLLNQPAVKKRFPAVVWRWDRERLRELIKVLMSSDGTVNSVGGHPRIELTAASEGLARDVHHALVRFGIVARLWKKKHGCWRVEITEPESVGRYQREIGWVGEKARRFGSVTRARKGNLGAVPRLIWTDIRASAASRAMTVRQLSEPAGEPGAGLRGFGQHRSRGVTQGRLAVYAGVARERRLSLLASDQIYWDEIVSIEPTGEHRVYDLTVPETSNFIAQDILVHNTSFVLNVALHAALEEKKSLAIFSLEMSKEQLTERLLTEQAQIDAQRMHRGLLTEAEFDRVSNALGPLGEATIFIDDTPVMDELTLQLKARQAKMRHDIDMILIDYLQLMHGRSRGDDSNRVQEVSAISRSLKGLARELRIPVVAISQLSRAPEQRPDKRPILSDLRESGSIEQDSDVVMFLFRPEYYKPDERPGIAEVIVAKHRNGPTGTIELKFRRDHTRFYNLETRRPEPGTA